jgi:hypothetical protein
MPNYDFIALDVETALNNIGASVKSGWHISKTGGKNVGPNWNERVLSVQIHDPRGLFGLPALR